MGFDDCAPAYATLDNAEMLQGVEGDYIGQASAYEDSTNVFVPYYRQTGMSTMYKARKETGDVDAAISGDITAALDYYYFEHYRESAVKAPCFSCGDETARFL